MLAKAIKMSRPSRSFSGTHSSLLSLGMGFVNQMTDLYVSRFESAFRILHIPTFRRRFEQYWTNPTGTPEVAQMQLELVIAIGTSLQSKAMKQGEVYTAAIQSLYAAQQWLSGPIEKDRLSIDALQLQCLLIVARQTLSFGSDLIWVAVGTLVRTAMQMGLHRDPKHYRKMDTLLVLYAYYRNVKRKHFS